MDEERLKAIPLFDNLNRKERRALAPRADEVTLEQGRVIVREGEWPYEFFAIEEGTVEVRRGDQLLAELGPGDFFGEMALLEADRRNATVTAMTPMELIVMTRASFRSIDTAMPHVHKTVQEAIEQRRVPAA
jgi:CRP-like cAMP-binding protein